MKNWHIISNRIGEPDEAIDGPDSGYDIIVDDDAINTQYGHDSPQIHQVQHIANVQTLQQFSPAYPVSPVYRPVVYHHEPSSSSYFKENDAPVVRTAANITDELTKSSSAKPAETTVKPAKEIEEIEKSENSLSSEQTEKIGSLEEFLTTLEAKLELASTTKLPAPMDEVLGVNATAKAN